MKNKEKEKTNSAVEYAKQFNLGSEYNIAFDSFIEGANWSDEHPRKGLVDIDKACEWLKDNIDYYVNKDFMSIDEFIGKFKKAMEEEQ